MNEIITSAVQSRILTIVIILFSGILLRQTLIFAGQMWVRTYTQTMTILILPIVTYVITSVISGNIALSLGMVGALSIVRFRNPVKSSFELAIYFFLITIGIAASVNLKWMIFLFGIVIFLLFFVKIIDAVYIKKYDESIFHISFSEGQSLSILEVVSSERLMDLERINTTIGFSFENDVYNYKFASSTVNDLYKIQGMLANRKIVSVRFNKA